MNGAQARMPAGRITYVWPPKRPAGPLAAPGWPAKPTSPSAEGRLNPRRLSRRIGASPRGGGFVKTLVSEFSNTLQDHFIPARAQTLRAVSFIAAL